MAIMDHVSQIARRIYVISDLMPLSSKHWGGFAQEGSALATGKIDSLMQVSFMST